MAQHNMEYGIQKTKSPQCTQYKTLVIPVRTYGSKTWILNAKDANPFGVFERRILRAVFGAMQENNEYLQKKI